MILPEYGAANMAAAFHRKRRERLAEPPTKGDREPVHDIHAHKRTRSEPKGRPHFKMWSPR